jgi:hypothetical protein
MLGEIMGEMTNMVGGMKGTVDELSQTVNTHSQSIVKLEAQVGQLANTSTEGKKGTFQVNRW